MRTLTLKNAMIWSVGNDSDLDLYVNTFEISFVTFY